MFLGNTDRMQVSNELLNHIATMRIICWKRGDNIFPSLLLITNEWIKLKSSNFVAGSIEIINCSGRFSWLYRLRNRRAEQRKKKGLVTLYVSVSFLQQSELIVASVTISVVSVRHEYLSNISYCQKVESQCLMVTWRLRRRHLARIQFLLQLLLSQAIIWSLSHWLEPFLLSALLDIWCLRTSSSGAAAEQEFQNSKFNGNSVLKFQYNLSCPYTSVNIRISHFAYVLVGRGVGQFICSLTYKSANWSRIF